MNMDFICFMLKLIGIPLAIGIGILLLKDFAVREGELRRYRDLQRKAFRGGGDEMLRIAEYCAHPNDLEKNRNLKRSVKYLMKAAEKGSAEANFRVGRMRLFGVDVEQDAASAVANLREGAELGSKDAMFLLAQCLELGIGVEQDDEQSQALLRQAAKKGSPEARFLLATRRDPGARELAKDVEDLQFASERLVPSATTCLADAYERGLGGARDSAKALALYCDAAEQGDPEGMFQYGLRLFYGLGCKRNENAARMWWRRAAALGAPRAEHVLEARSRPTMRR